MWPLLNCSNKKRNVSVSLLISSLFFCFFERNEVNNWAMTEFRQWLAITGFMIISPVHSADRGKTIKCQIPLSQSHSCVTFSVWTPAETLQAVWGQKKTGRSVHKYWQNCEFKNQRVNVKVSGQELEFPLQECHCVKLEVMWNHAVALSVIHSSLFSPLAAVVSPWNQRDRHEKLNWNSSKEKHTFDWKCLGVGMETPVIFGQPLVLLWTCSIGTWTNLGEIWNIASSYMKLIFTRKVSKRPIRMAGKDYNHLFKLLIIGDSS